MRLIDEETLKKSIEKWLNPDPNADRRTMMGRLIDEDELVKGRVENDPVVIASKCTPTAYDPDKVVAELEKLADKANDKILEAGELQLYYDWYEDALRTAVEVVKGGGVDA
jgi:hypothetical protein